MNCCSNNVNAIMPECSLVYSGTVTSIVMRKNKKGKYQIKVNGKGPWINAHYDEESKTITYYQ